MPNRSGIKLFNSYLPPETNFPQDLGAEIVKVRGADAIEESKEKSAPLTSMDAARVRARVMATVERLSKRAQSYTRDALRTVPRKEALAATKTAIQNYLEMEDEVFEASMRSLFQKYVHVDVNYSAFPTGKREIFWKLLQEMKSATSTMNFTLFHFDSLKEFLQNIEKKSKFYFSITTVGRALDREGFEDLIPFVKEGRVTECMFSTAVLDENQIKKLTEAFRQPENGVKSCSLSSTKMNATGAQHLAEALQDKNCKIENLSLDANPIGLEGMRALAKALTNENCKVKNLSLSRQAMSSEELKLLCDALVHPDCKVEKLSLSGNRLKTEDIKILSEALKHPECKVTECDLSGIGLDHEGLRLLAESLQDENCKIKKCNLGSNRLSDRRSIELLLNTLSHPSCKITECDLSGNDIKDPEAEMILRHFSEPEAKSIGFSLSRNLIANAKYLKDFLKYAPAITYFDLRDNLDGRRSEEASPAWVL